MSEVKEGFVILRNDTETLASAMPLGGGLVIIDSHRLAQLWRDVHSTKDKRPLYSIYPVTVTCSGVPMEELPSEVLKM